MRIAQDDPWSTEPTGGDLRRLQRDRSASSGAPPALTRCRRSARPRHCGSRTRPARPFALCRAPSAPYRDKAGHKGDQGRLPKRPDGLFAQTGCFREVPWSRSFLRLPARSVHRARRLARDPARRAGKAPRHVSTDVTPAVHHRGAARAMWLPSVLLGAAVVATQTACSLYIHPSTPVPGDQPYLASLGGARRYCSRRRA
jgi:hypothetical protein